MNRLTGQFRKFNVQNRARTGFLKIRGNVDADTRRSFSRSMDRILGTEIKWLIVDLFNVNYMNSTGVGVLIRARDRLREDGGGIALTRVDKNVGQVLYVLGLTEVVPIYSSLKKALRFIALREIKKQEPETPSVKRGPVRFIDKRSRSLPEDASVFFFLNEHDLFLETVQMRLSGDQREFFTYHNYEEGREKLEDVKPDLIVLEDRLQGTNEFIEDLKTRKEHSLIPIIKLYDEGADPDHESSFHIWENNSLVEPFDMVKLFALAEAELVRVRARKEKYLLHLHYSFRPEGKNHQKAGALGTDVIQKSDLGEEDAAGFQKAFLEALDNAIQHGIENDPEQRVDVVFLLTKNRLTVRVQDEGDGFDFESELERARNMDTVERSLETQQNGGKGGLGIKIMLFCSDELTYDSPGNSVRLTKQI